MVHFVGAGPGAPDLITRRGAALLADADCITMRPSFWARPKILTEAAPAMSSGNKVIKTNFIKSTPAV